VKEDKVAGVQKVIGLSKLRTKYESHEKRRQLAGSYDLFMADDRVLPSLAKALGKSFFKKKKQPVPVRLAGRDWGTSVQRACEATYLFMSGGNSLSLKVARTGQSGGECVENVLKGLDGGEFSRFQAVLRSLLCLFVNPLFLWFAGSFLLCTLLIVPCIDSDIFCSLCLQWSKRCPRDGKE
jgi:hypothetical protein